MRPVLVGSVLVVLVTVGVVVLVFDTGSSETPEIDSGARTRAQDRRLTVLEERVEALTRGLERSEANGPAGDPRSLAGDAASVELRRQVEELQHRLDVLEQRASDERGDVGGLRDPLLGADAPGTRGGRRACRRRRPAAQLGRELGGTPRSCHGTRWWSGSRSRSSWRPAARRRE